MRRTLVLLAGLVPALVPGLAAAEVCRFEGTTSHSGQVAVRSEVVAVGDVVTVDVTMAVTISAWVSEVRYLTQEISTWRGDSLQSVAVNSRTVINGRVGRQLWDVMVRDADGLQARRVQAKDLAGFQHRHPGFVRHWAVAAFGQPWLQDYAAASAERRPDLDLAAAGLIPGVRTPLALAFYWSRWLAPAGGVAPVFLPGFKHDKRTELTFGPAAAGDGWRRWQASLLYPGLDSATPSMAAAWVSLDGHLLQLAFDVHLRLGSGQALLRTQGCQGIEVMPAGQSR